MDGPWVQRSITRPFRMHGIRDTPTAMSQENVELVRKGYDAMLEGGIEAALAYIDPQFEMDLPPEIGPEPQVVRGHEALRRWFETAMEVLEEFRIEPEEFIDAGEQVVVPVRILGRGRTSGIEAVQRVTQVWTIRDGLSVRMDSYVDTESALAAAVGRSAGRPVDVVSAQFAAFASGDLAAVAEFWHPDIDWRAVEGAADDVGVIKGHAGLRRYYQDWIETFDQLQAEVEEVLAENGDRVAVVVHNSGIGRVSGVPTDGHYYVTCTVRDGLIVSGREYATREQAIDAARS
jgi:ketosteroid isomerase-like protein